MVLREMKSLSKNLFKVKWQYKHMLNIFYLKTLAINSETVLAILNPFTTTTIKTLEHIFIFYYIGIIIIHYSSKRLRV